MKRNPEQSEILIKSLQYEADGLMKNCQRWATKVNRLYKVADKMAAVCKNRRFRADYWQEKSRA